jgi:hypothetical protein
LSRSQFSMNLPKRTPPTLRRSESHGIASGVACRLSAHPSSITPH